jgi:hypothetical protein
MRSIASACMGELSATETETVRTRAVKACLATASGVFYPTSVCAAVVSMAPIPLLIGICVILVR